MVQSLPPADRRTSDLFKLSDPERVAIVKASRPPTLGQTLYPWYFFW